MNSKLISVVLFFTTVIPLQIIAEVQSYSLEAGQNAVGVTLIKPAWQRPLPQSFGTRSQRIWKSPARPPMLPL